MWFQFIKQIIFLKVVLKDKWLVYEYKFFSFIICCGDKLSIIYNERERERGREREREVK